MQRNNAHNQQNNAPVYDLGNAALIKRDLSTKLRDAMSQKHVSQAELARRMHTSRAVIHRLLDEEDLSVTLATIGKAASALGQVFRFDASPDLGKNKARGNQ
jgi:antitoxin HicB